jgi:hypothetical protein
VQCQSAERSNRYRAHRHRTTIEASTADGAAHDAAMPAGECAVPRCERRSTRRTNAHPWYNYLFIRVFTPAESTPAMEAEELNQITNTLAGLADRAQALRRYL